MLDRFWPRRALAALAAAGAALAAASAEAAPASASSSVASSAASSPAASSPALQAIGGARLADRGVIVSYPPGSTVAHLPNVQASAFVIADANTGQVLAAKDPHGWYRPASTLKMLTAISLIPLLNPDATTVASKQATSAVPNVAGLVTGQSYMISDLFTALLTISANDAAIALTQAVGSYSEGMDVINAEAHHLQADDTVAVDPNGLDAPGQHTSAYDLALFARQALKLPAFLKYDQTITAQFRISKGKSETLYNQNSLLTTYPGAVGGKIGWTSAAGATYVGMATRNGVTLIVTLLHCPALTEINTAKSLLNWGFAADEKVTPVGSLVAPLQPPAAVPAAPAAVAIVATPRAKATSAAARPAAGPSVLAAAGFSAVVVIAAGLGLVYSRRQRQRQRPRDARAGRAVRGADGAGRPDRGGAARADRGGAGAADPLGPRRVPGPRTPTGTQGSPRQPAGRTGPDRSRRGG
jgi:serine-type D-Ala-D-Ala carboxypeptidase (penicillin-binding protein 5/6)